MGFKYLVRDQEVEGSNPFAPTTKTLSLNELRICRASVLHEICSARSANRVRGRATRLPGRAKASQMQDGRLEAKAGQAKKIEPIYRMIKRTSADRVCITA